MQYLNFPALLHSEENEEAWAYFEESTLSIEILKDNVLQKVYFQVKDKVFIIIPVHPVV